MKNIEQHQHILASMQARPRYALRVLEWLTLASWIAVLATIVLGHFFLSY